MEMLLDMGRNASRGPRTATMSDAQGTELHIPTRNQDPGLHYPGELSDEKKQKKRTRTHTHTKKQNVKNKKEHEHAKELKKKENMNTPK